MGLYPCTACRSSRSMRPLRCAMEESCTTRGALACRSKGSSSPVSAKWPEKIHAELHLEPIRRHLAGGQRHDAGIVDQPIQRAMLRRDARREIPHRGEGGEVERLEFHQRAGHRRPGSAPPPPCPWQHCGRPGSPAPRLWPAPARYRSRCRYWRRSRRTACPVREGISRPTHWSFHAASACAAFTAK